jgi:hypothetical protein
VEEIQNELIKEAGLEMCYNVLFCQTIIPRYLEQTTFEQTFGVWNNIFHLVVVLR